MLPDFPSIDLEATGANIKRLREKNGLSVRAVQEWFKFTEPRAIYKWQSGQTLPSVDNLVALSKLFRVKVDEIIICKVQLTLVKEPERDGSVFLSFFRSWAWNSKFLFLCVPF